MSKKKIRELEQRIDKDFPVIEQPDGTRIRYRRIEALGALAAAIDGEEHRLRLAFRQEPKERGGIPAMINALEDSKKRIEEENREAARES